MVMQPAQPLRVTVGDIEMAYRVFGQGEPLILIMGLTGTLDNWDPTLVEELARHYLVIPFDNRGMGASTSAGEYAFEQLADDTAGLLRALGLEQAHVLGWSTGGDIALDLALRHPDRVSRLVLYAGDCGGEEAINPPAEILAQLSDVAGTPEEQGRRLLPLLFPAEWLAQNVAYVRRVFVRPMETSTPESMARQIKAQYEWPGACSRLAEVKQPTLIVQGMADLLTPPANAQLLANGIPGSWLARFAGAGHGLQYQYPRHLAALIRTFLQAP